MALVLLERTVSVYQDVVNVGRGKVVQKLSEDPVDISLEGTWGVGQAKGHHEPLKQAITCPDGGLPFVPCCDT
jgi:hypothetical protein